GIVGCGAIGSLVSRLLEKKYSSFHIAALFDQNTDSALRLSKRLHPHPRVCAGLSELVNHCDIVLEAASVQASFPIAQAALKKGRPIVMMSTGGFLLHRKKLTALAERTRTKIYLPSGAVCGLDGLKAARQIGKIKKIRITSTKPP